MELDSALRPFMYGKIHRCTVTDADLHYIGSITIDTLLMKAAGILPHTRVDVVNISNGERIKTYVIEGPENYGVICINGAAAHKFSKGDLAIIMAYELVPAKDIPGRVSRVVMVDEENKIINVEENITNSFEALKTSNRYAKSYEDALGNLKISKLEN